MRTDPHVSGRRRLIGLPLAAIALVASPPAEARNTAAWATASGVGRDVLVGAALGIPAVKGDWHGDIAAGRAWA